MSVRWTSRPKKLRPRTIHQNRIVVRTCAMSRVAKSSRYTMHITKSSTQQGRSEDWDRLGEMNQLSCCCIDQSGILTGPSPANGFRIMITLIRGFQLLSPHVSGIDLPLNKPPRRGPAIAEQHQVRLSACDHFARLATSTISEVTTQTEFTIPPPPMPAGA